MKNIIYYNNYFYFYTNKKNMMTKFSVLTVSAFTLFLVSCKPAAEDRVKMHENANGVSLHSYLHGLQCENSTKNIIFMLFGNYLGGVHPHLTKRNGKNTVYDGHKSAPKKIPHMCIFPAGKCEKGL